MYPSLKFCIIPNYVNPLLHRYSFSYINNRQPLKTLWEKEQLLVMSNCSFPQCFLLNQIIVCPFVHSFDTTSLFDAELEEPKIGISGKGLKSLTIIMYLLFVSDFLSFFFSLYLSLLKWKKRVIYQS